MRPLKKAERDRMCVGVCTTARGRPPKRSYPSKSAAKRAMKAINKVSPERRQVRVYQCACGDWHTTTEPYRPAAPAMVDTLATTTKGGTQDA